MALIRAERRCRADHDCGRRVRPMPLAYPLTGERPGFPSTSSFRQPSSSRANPHRDQLTATVETHCRLASRSTDGAAHSRSGRLITHPQPGRLTRPRHRVTDRHHRRGRPSPTSVRSATIRRAHPPRSRPSRYRGLLTSRPQEAFCEGTRPAPFVNLAPSTGDGG